MNKFIFLTQDFYNAYPAEQYPEIEHKLVRPYIQVLIDIDDMTFAIPMRSNISHPFVLWTDKENKCGVDFSKTVVITDERFIDKERKPHIRPNEFDALRGKEYTIKKKLLRYIKDFKKAKCDLTKEYNKKLYDFSTLKYFEKYIEKF